MEGSIYRMAATKMEKYIVRLAIVLDAVCLGGVAGVYFVKNWT